MIEYLIDMLVYAAIFGILALSLNIEAGFTGLMNFGKVAFFAIGAYTSALLTLSGLPFFFALISGVMLSGFFGFLIAIPTLKLREDYLAIVTLAFGEIIRLFLLNEMWLTEGPMGLSGIPQPMHGLFSHYSLFYAIFVLFFLLICYYLAERIVNSPFGRVLKSIREDETAAQAMGKDTFAFKTRAFFIGSCMAGLAGSLFAHYITYINPEMFLPMITFSVWTMMIVGGKANNFGVIFGAVLIQLFERSTRFLKDIVSLPIEPYNLRIIVIGLLLILFMMYMPDGILKERKA